MLTSTLRHLWARGPCCLPWRCEPKTTHCVICITCNQVTTNTTFKSMKPHNTEIKITAALVMALIAACDPPLEEGIDFPADVDDADFLA